MERKEFIQKYVIQYVADKMSRLNRNEVGLANQAEIYASCAVIEAEQVWNFLKTNSIVNS